MKPICAAVGSRISNNKSEPPEVCRDLNQSFVTLSHNGVTTVRKYKRKKPNTVSGLSVCSLNILAGIVVVLLYTGPIVGGLGSSISCTGYDGPATNSEKPAELTDRLSLDKRCWAPIALAIFNQMSGLWPLNP